MRSHRLPRASAIIGLCLSGALPGLVAARPAAAQSTTFSASGANPAAIQATVDNFRTAIGGGNVPGANGSFGGVRREVNWDGVPDASSAPNNLPANFFNVNSPRGVVFSTAGTGFQTSADAVNPTATPVEFGNINPQYPTIFQTFSAERLFTPLGSNIMDVNFFIPGTATPTFVTAFGVVFCDVDNGPTAPIIDRTTLEFFTPGNVSLGVFSAAAADDGLSFLGVQFTGGQQVGRVRIKTGNEALGRNDEFFDDIVFTDMVVMDDFIYSEPVNPTAGVAAPEPATLGFLLLGGTVGVWRRVRRVRRA
jgi:hypothetical protein